MAKPKHPAPKPAEEQFDEIIERALSEADGIDCPIGVYIQNLKLWLSPYGPISVRLDAAKATSGEEDD